MAALSEASRDQAGYVTTAQARRLGIDADTIARIARRGDLRRVAHGIYALPGAFRGPREDLIAGWLRLTRDRLPWDASEPAAVASHTSAAAIYDFGTFSPDVPTFTVMRRRFQPPDRSLQVYTAHLEPTDWQWFVLAEGLRIPVTTPARTIVDLAFAGEERGRVLDALADARDAGLLTDAAVADALDRRRRRRGRGSASWLAPVVTRG
jgi:predicted transcriptional regulator of viral defense system